MAWTREQMPARAAKELRDGYHVNLGIGIPTLVSNYIPDGMDISLQSENGMLGMGPFPYEGEEDPDLISAGKQTVSELPSTSYSPARTPSAVTWTCRFSAPRRSPRTTDLTNRMVPGKMVKGMGGAMDLVAGVKRVVVVMENSGTPALLSQFSPHLLKQHRRFCRCTTAVTKANKRNGSKAPCSQHCRTAPWRDGSYRAKGFHCSGLAEKSPALRSNHELPDGPNVFALTCAGVAPTSAS